MGLTADRAKAVVGWLLVLIGGAFGAMIAAIAAVSSLMFLIPAVGCDSHCWENDTLMRVLGVIGLPLALATAGVVPVAARFRRTRPRLAVLMVASVAVSMAVWWNVTEHLVGSAVAASGFASLI